MDRPLHLAAVGSGADGRRVGRGQQQRAADHRRGEAVGDQRGEVGEFLARRQLEEEAARRPSVGDERAEDLVADQLRPRQLGRPPVRREPAPLRRAPPHQLPRRERSGGRADAEQPAGREERTAQRRGVPRLRALASARPTCRPEGTERVDGVAGPPGGGLVGRAGQMGRREARRRRGEHRPEALGPEGDEEGRPGGRIVGQVLEIAQHRVDGVPVAVQELAPAFGRQPAGDQPRR